MSLYIVGCFISWFVDISCLNDYCIMYCRFGPLRHQWCMRFEAKNHYIKRLVGLNFKNVPKSVATRHQYYMCLRQLSPPGTSTNFLYIGDKIGKGITVHVHVVYLYTYMYMYIHIILHIVQLYGCYMYMYNHGCNHVHRIPL